MYIKTAVTKCRLTNGPMEPITKEQPAESMGLVNENTTTKHNGGGGSFVYLAISIASLLAFTCGTAFSWASPSLPKLKSDDLNLNPLAQAATPQEASWVAGTLGLGATFGPMLTFYLSDKIGRKRTMLLFAVPALVSFLTLAFAKTVWLFYVARFMQGFGVAATFSVLPVFIGEVSESHNRGGLSCMQGLFIACGLLFSYIAGPYVSLQIFCLACAVPPTLFLVFFWWFVPETPYYLVAIKERKAAQESLAKYRGKTPEQVEKELLEITRNVEESFADKATISDLFRTPSVCKALFVSIGLVCFQQFFGINVILSYMQTIFASTGSSISAELSTIIMGLVQVGSVVMSALLIDRLGRRLLLMVSAVGSGVAQASMGVYFYLQLHAYNVAPIFWLPIASLFVFMVCFNFGFSTVPFTIMGELFPPNLKMVATTIACCILLLLAFVTTLVFPILESAIGIANCFWLFGGCCAVGFVFVYLAVPETKGKTLAEVQKMLGEKDN